MHYLREIEIAKNMDGPENVDRLKKPPPKNPQPIRFEALADERVPVGYINIAEALSLIGEKFFKGRWGASDGIRTLPIFCHSKGGYFRVGFADSDYRRPYWTCLGPSDRYSSLHFKLFMSVKHYFEFGFESSAFKIHPLHPQLGLLAPLNKGVLAAQHLYVFGTGRVQPPDAAFGDPYLVCLIEEPAFFQWLNTFDRQSAYPDFDTPPTKLKISVIPSSVQEAAIAFLRKHDLVASREWLWETFEHAAPAGRKLSGNDFKKSVWASLPVELKQPSEHPSNAVRQRRIELQQALQKHIADAFRRHT